MQLGEQEFLRSLGLIDNEVETAFITFQSYEELNRLALEDEEILKVLNADAMFWRGYRSTMLTALFMTTSRLFDPASDAVTAQSLVTAVLSNVHLFSKDVLAARKAGTGPKPDWLDEYMASVWAPTTSGDLRHLKKALAPHIARFNQIYLPIRNSIYAHRLMTDEQAGSDPFPSTNRHELGETIDFLQDLLCVVRNLYYNGIEPILGRCNLAGEKKEARASVERVLRKLAQLETKNQPSE